MRSDLHQQLQYKAIGYLLNKGYWICGEEVPMPIGVCDAWGMSRSNLYNTMAIEVKVSKSDFRSSSQKGKENTSYKLGNYQYILCPADLIQPQDIHAEWGLLWWSGKKIINKKKAPLRIITPQEKLEVLISFLENGSNPHRPLLSIPNLDSD